MCEEGSKNINSKIHTNAVGDDSDLLMARFADAMSPLIDRFGYDGVDVIGRFMAAVGRSDPKIAHYLLKRSPAIITELMAQSPNTVVDVYVQAERILPYGSLPAVRFIETGAALVTAGGYEALAKTTDLACEAARVNPVITVAVIETAPAIIQAAGFEGLKVIGRFGATVAASSWIYGLKALENSPAIVKKLVQTGGIDYVQAVYGLGAAMAGSDFSAALKLVEQSHYIAQKLVTLTDKTFLTDLYAQALKSVSYGPGLVFLRIEKAAGIIERLGPAGYGVIEDLVTTLAMDDPQKAATLINETLPITDRLLEDSAPSLVIDIYQIGQTLSAGNASLGLNFILSSPAIGGGKDVAVLKAIADAAQKIAAISNVAANAFVKAAPKLLDRLGLVGALKFCDDIIPIASISWETAARLLARSPEIFDRVGLEGLKSVAEFATFLAPKDHSAAVLLLDKSGAVIDQLKKIDRPYGLDSLAALFALGRQMASLNARLAVSMVATGPQIIAKWGFEGLNRLEPLVRRTGDISWTAAVALVQAAPDIIKRVGFGGLGQIGAVAIAVAKKNSYGAVSLLEKSPALVDRLIKCENKALALTVYAIAAETAPVSWRLATTFLEKSPELFSLVSTEGLITLSKLLTDAARVSGQVAARMLTVSPAAIETMTIDGLAALSRLATRIAIKDVDGAIKLVEKSPLVMQQLKESGGRNAVAAAYALAADLADTSPAVGNRFLKKCPGFLDQVGLEGLLMVSAFIKKTARSDPEKALVFLSGETTAFTDFMETIPKGLELKKARPILSIYLKALLGRRVEIASAKNDYTDGKKIYLPERIRDFEDDSDNFSAYKVLVTHLEAHLEYGSFEFDLSKIEGLMARIESHYGLKPAGDENDLERFVDHFPEPDLARDLFNLMEDFRIETILKREYPVLAGKIERMHRYHLKKRRTPQKIANPKQRVVEAIGQMVVAGKGIELDCSASMSILSLAEKQSKSLVSPAADVHDAAKAAFLLYRAIDQNFDQDYRPVKPMSEPIDQDMVSSNIGSFGKTSRHIRERLQKGQAAKHQRPPAPTESRSNQEYEIQPTHNRPDQKNIQKGPGRNSQDQRSFEGRSGGGKQKSGDFDQKSDQASPANTQMKFDSAEKIERLLRAVHRERGITPKEIGRRIEGLNQNTLDLFLHHLERSLKQKTQLVSEPGTYLYPEWGADISDYRDDWAKVHQHVLSGQSLDFYRDTLEKHAGLLKQIRREFQMLKPEGFVRKKRQFDGDDIDIDAMVEYLVDRKAGLSPVENNYYLTQKKKRDIAVAFLVDMSKSTKGGIIEREKEALVMMSEALFEVGDSFAIYGFSGDNRDNVDFYLIKNFDERYDNNIKKRISAIANRFENRDGTAIRHTIRKLKSQPEKTRIIILLSDGKPVDKEYSGAYAIEDTRMALKEAQQNGIKTFCITVDQAAADYLPRMYRHSSWVVIDDVTKLPEKITRIYRRLTT